MGPARDLPRVSVAIALATHHLTEACRAALSAIDAVHSDGDLGIDGQPLTVIEGGIDTIDYEGTFSITSSRPFVPSSIALAPSGPSPALAFVHEIGHFLDFWALGRKPQAAEPYFASAQDPRLEPWRRAVADSETVILLNRIRRGVAPKGAAPVRREHVRYLLEPQELFARTYTQFIATSSGSETLREQLAGKRQRAALVGYPQFWPDVEFESIAQEFATLWSRPRMDRVTRDSRNEDSTSRYATGDVLMGPSPDNAYHPQDADQWMDRQSAGALARRWGKATDRNVRAAAGAELVEILVSAIARLRSDSAGPDRFRELLDEVGAQFAGRLPLELDAFLLHRAEAGRWPMAFRSLLNGGRGSAPSNEGHPPRRAGTG